VSNKKNCSSTLNTQNCPLKKNVKLRSAHCRRTYLYLHFLEYVELRSAHCRRTFLYLHFLEYVKLRSAHCRRTFLTHLNARERQLMEGFYTSMPRRGN